jgi:hypothetical protein
MTALGAKRKAAFCRILAINLLAAFFWNGQSSLVNVREKHRLL